jgi:hypothetical protein
LIIFYLKIKGGEDICDCSGMVSKRSFDYFFPCHFSKDDPSILMKNVDCDVIEKEQELGVKPTDEIRMHLIHTTVGVICFSFCFT